MRTAVALILLAGAAQAEEVRYLSSSGWMFTAETNADGAVLTSVQDYAFFTNAGAASSWDVRPFTIYMGTGCDTASPDFGEGEWSWANGGWVLNVGEFALAFPRQDAPVATTDCAM